MRVFVLSFFVALTLVSAVSSDAYPSDHERTTLESYRENVKELFIELMEARHDGRFEFFATRFGSKWGVSWARREKNLDNNFEREIDRLDQSDQLDQRLEILRFKIPGFGPLYTYVYGSELRMFYAASQVEWELLAARFWLAIICDESPKACAPYIK